MPRVSDHRTETQFGEPLRRLFTTIIDQHVSAGALMLAYVVELIVSILAPGGHSMAPSSAVGGFQEDYSGPMVHQHPGEKPMSRLQVALQRKLMGWPLYTVVLAIGQVRDNDIPLNKQV